MPALKERRGSIVNVTSVAGLQGRRQHHPLRGEQGGRQLHDQIPRAASPPAVRVNAVAPGPILTCWLTHHMDMVELRQQTPMRRWQLRTTLQTRSPSWPWAIPWSRGRWSRSTAAARFRLATLRPLVQMPGK